ncbi:trypsin-2-like isoform X2 [Bacillus rossius redtenbacheri]|uniref:trypsin-2-like isoform X2 n=1 Tax=Bacillus rossius redtenbacheri TaxID=93214 RepID=UPI002FDD51BE
MWVRVGVVVLLAAAGVCDVSGQSTQRSSSTTLVTTPKPTSFRTKEPRIIGGSNAKAGQYPYQVSLKSGGAHFCGGAIIALNRILTAGHCVTQVHPNNIEVVAGILRSSDNTVVRSVSKIICHENYTTGASGEAINDIAILELSSPMPADNSYIEAIPTATVLNEEQNNCVVSGWGVVKWESKKVAPTLQFLRVPLVSFDKCIVRYPQLVEGQICAGYLDGSGDACQGDSGGPLACGGKLTGIVSWGYGCATPGYPGVYADVAHYSTWLQRHLEDSSGVGVSAGDDQEDQTVSNRNCGSTVAPVCTLLLLVLKAAL